MLKYIEGSEVKITENDGIFIDVEFYHTETKYVSLEARRLFPRSGSNKYIVLLDSEGEQIAVIRNLDNLDAASKAVVQKALDEYYFIPKITKFIKMSAKFKIWLWTVETDAGIIEFEIRNHLASIKPLYDGRVLIKDANDNSYEIPDYRKLDAKSRKMLIPKL